MAMDYMTSSLNCIFLEGGWEDEKKETTLKDDINLFVLEKYSKLFAKVFP